MRRSRIRTLATLILTLTALGAGTVACGEDPEVAAADRRMCNAVDRLDEVRQAFSEAGGENRREELAAARDDLFDALAELTHASSDVAQARDEAGDNPATELNTELQDIPDDASPSEVAEQTAVAGGNFLAGVKDLLVGREC